MYFDRVAWFYDILSALPSLNAIAKSRISLISELPIVNNCLIVGGGTGDIMEELTNQKKALNIHFVEPSGKMLEIAKGKFTKKQCTGTNIFFINANIEDFKIQKENYDLIVTNYFFDLFPQNKAEQILLYIQNGLSKEGIWLCTDFTTQNKSILKRAIFKLLLLIIYFFFRITCQVPAYKLINLDELFNNSNMKKTREKSFYFGFLKSSIWKIK